MDVYPNNTAAKFTTALPQALDLEGNWEVALSEINVPARWYNIREEVHWLKLNQHYINIPGGFFLTVPDVMRKMVDEIKKVEEYKDVDMKVFQSARRQITWAQSARGFQFIFVYVYENNRVIINVPLNVTMEFSPDLANVLGMPHTVYHKPENVSQQARGFQVSSELQPGLVDNTMMAYVYCDIVESTIVGDSKVPLLRTVNLDSKADNIINHIYTSPVYRPIQKKHFDTIETYIYTDTGRPIPFETGKSVVTLHFRRTSNPYFLSR